MQRERGSRNAATALPSRPRAIAKKKQRPPSVNDLSVGRTELLTRRDVSRETLDCLDIFVALLLEWQAKTNLVAPSTLSEMWSRHIEDSLQLGDIVSEPKRWVDLGSGAGFPGIVMAILMRGKSGHVDLVESNDKKAAFLRAVIRETGISATVHAERIEDCAMVLSKADAVSARALASLDTLLGLVAGRITPGIPCYFAKGRNHEQEIIDASQHWRFSMVKHSSKLEDASVLLEIRDIRAV